VNDATAAGLLRELEARGAILSGHFRLSSGRHSNLFVQKFRILEDPVLVERVARAFYQVQTTTSAGGGYFETFMGDDGTIKMSEDPSLCAIYREARADAVSWDDLAQKGYVRAIQTSGDATKVDVRETAQLAQYEIPVFFNKPPHQSHLENFFNAIRGTAKLNCPGDEAFTSEYVIHKANEAVGAERKLLITSEEVKA